MEQQTKVLIASGFTERDIAAIGVAVSGCGWFLECGKLTAADLYMEEEEVKRLSRSLAEVLQKLEPIQQQIIEARRELQDREDNSEDDALARH